VIIGYTGQLSSGHNGFVGFVRLHRRLRADRAGRSVRLTFVLAAIVTALFALCDRAGGAAHHRPVPVAHHAGVRLTLETTLFEVPSFTNAGAGQPADLPERFLLDPKQYYWLCLAIVAVAVYFDWRLLRSKVGRALLALKENERVAEAFGVNVTGYKLLAFTFSGLLAGVAGAMFAYFSGSVVGNNFGFSTFLFLTFVLMVVVGGAGSRVGVIVGSAFSGSWTTCSRRRRSTTPSTPSSARSARPAWLPSSSPRSSWERCCSSSRSSSTRADRAAAPPDHPLAVRASRSACTATTTPVPALWRAPVSVLEVRDLSIRFGGLQALQDVSLRSTSSRSSG
jgi:ABC-type branched-subunit amino acid transport system permease subunit